MASRADRRPLPRTVLGVCVALWLLLGGLPAVARADAGDPGPPTSRNSWIARVVYASDLHADASRSSAVTGRVLGQTMWGSPAQLLVKDSQREAGELWLNVRVLGRPNGRDGWIEADSATLSRTAWRVEVNRAARTLTVFTSGRVAKRVKVVVGTPGTPTPTGFFAVADKLELRHARGFLGNYVLPLTAYSDVLTSFDGGIGQIAIHGRGPASLKDALGTAASHGCVRVANKDMRFIADRVPVGAPVVIS